MIYQYTLNTAFMFLQISESVVFLLVIIGFWTLIRASLVAFCTRSNLLLCFNLYQFYKLFLQTKTGVAEVAKDLAALTANFNNCSALFNELKAPNITKDKVGPANSRFSGFELNQYILITKLTSLGREAQSKQQERESAPSSGAGNVSLNLAEPTIAAPLIAVECNLFHSQFTLLRLKRVSKRQRSTPFRGNSWMFVSFSADVLPYVVIPCTNRWFELYSIVIVKSQSYSLKKGIFQQSFNNNV
uniref:Uncharacterized protein n=1 Tax=Glossina austeni TaxID=7395 RepID=A0A1A9UZ79_GLOAU